MTHDISEGIGNLGYLFLIPQHEIKMTKKNKNPSLRNHAGGKNISQCPKTFKVAPHYEIAMINNCGFW